MSERIAVIGAGAMGGAVVSALAASGAVPAASIVVSEIDAARREAVATANGATAGRGLPHDVTGAQALVLAVKPQSFPAVAEAIRPALERNATGDLDHGRRGDWRPWNRRWAHLA